MKITQTAKKKSEINFSEFDFELSSIKKPRNNQKEKGDNRDRYFKSMRNI